MVDQQARRLPGRPRKHASGSARTTAWRNKYGLSKVTVEVPKNFVTEIQRLARGFRKAATFLDKQQRARVYHVFFMTRGRGVDGESRFDQMADEIITYLNFATPPDERRKPHDLLKWLYEHCLTSGEQQQFLRNLIVNASGNTSGRDALVERYNAGVNKAG
jgi:hypothetical protein